MQDTPNKIEYAREQLKIFIHRNQDKVSSMAGTRCPAKYISGRWFIYCHPRKSSKFGALFYEHDGSVYTANGPAMSVVDAGGPARRTEGSLPSFSTFDVLKHFKEE